MSLAVDGMNSVSLPGPTAGVGQTVMREQPVKNDAGSLFYFQGNHIFQVERRIVKNLKLRSARFLSPKPGTQRCSMSSGLSPHAAVLLCRVFESKPKSDT